MSFTDDFKLYDLDSVEFEDEEAEEEFNAFLEESGVTSFEEYYTCYVVIVDKDNDGVIVACYQAEYDNFFFTFYSVEDFEEFATVESSSITLEQDGCSFIFK